ncbi:MAG TPA: hypothetical protein VML75_18395 [Kofleriaceae bacterium]|nr:hypothetical protein [Kofleriaceae bacterium]
MTALSAAVATTGACTKAAESKERAPAQQQPATPLAGDPAPVEGVTDVAPEKAELAKAEGAEPGAAEPEPTAEPERTAEPKMLTAVTRGSGARALANVTVTKQYYTLEIKVPPAAARGKASEVVLTLVPRNGRHLNHEFPTKLTITPPAGVTVAKPTLKRSDAETFTDDLATFKVSFTAADAGEKAFSGKFKFAVCTDTTCDPQTEQLAFKVSVK